MRMNIFSSLIPSCLALVSSLAVFGQAASETAAERYGYAPAESAAGAAFRMTLSPYGYDCNTGFEAIGAVTTDTSITLSFVHRRRKDTLDCRVVRMVPPVLEYKLPALRAGKYPLYAVAYPECAYNPDPNGPICKIALRPELIGAVAVGSEPPRIDSAWHPRPVKTLSQKPFQLAVVNSLYGNCQTTFYGQTMRVDADKRVIHLSFGAETHPDRVCVQDVRPHGPTFAAPALKAGRYQVLVSQLPACAIPREPDGPVCLIHVEPVAAAESLAVQDETFVPGTGWFVQPVSVRADAGFRLSVLNYAYHPCAFDFTHASLIISGRTIRARFAVERSGNDLCTADIRAGGPEFPVAGLAAGDYQVYVSTPAACLFAPQPCDIAEPEPELVDTLHVVLDMPLASGAHPGIAPSLQGGKARIERSSGILGVLMPGLERARLDVLGRRMP